MPHLFFFLFFFYLPVYPASTSTSSCQKQKSQPDLWTPQECIQISERCVYLHPVRPYRAICWKSNYLSVPPMQWGGLLSLKETEINISALEDTFPVMEARNLTLAFILMLAFTVTFALIAYQEIFSPVLMTLTKPAPGFQSSKLLNAHCWHYSVTNVKCLACKAGKFEDRSRYFACRVSCSRGNCSFFCYKLKGGKRGDGNVK